VIDVTQDTSSVLGRRLDMTRDNTNNVFLGVDLVDVTQDNTNSVLVNGRD